jgi:hypothetical protein
VTRFPPARRSQRTYGVAVDPVSAIADAAGEVFKFGTSVVTGFTAKAQNASDLKEQQNAYTIAAMQAEQQKALVHKITTGFVIVLGVTGAVGIGWLVLKNWD